LITGTPSTGTRFLTTLTVTDSLGAAQSATVAWTITTATGVQVVTPTADRGDALGTTVSVPLSAAGGTGTGYTWTASGLPPGATLSGSTIGGTLTRAGSYTVTLTVRDSNQNRATFMFTWTVQ